VELRLYQHPVPSERAHPGLHSYYTGFSDPEVVSFNPGKACAAKQPLALLASRIVVVNHTRMGQGGNAMPRGGARDTWMQGTFG